MYCLFLCYMDENLNIDNIDKTEQEISDEDLDDISIIPEPNYAVVSDIDYEEDRDENMNYHNNPTQGKDTYALGVPCIEENIVSKIKSVLNNKDNIVDIEHIGIGDRDGTHIIIRYKASPNNYMDIARNMIDGKGFIRDIRNDMSVCEEYKSLGSRIKDKVGRSDLRYIY